MKGSPSPQESECIEQVDLSRLFLSIAIVDSVSRSTGGQHHLGNMTLLSPSPGETDGWATISIKEGIILLKPWILSCLLLTARAFFPCDITIWGLKHVYQVALGVDTLGVTLDILPRPPPPPVAIATRKSRTVTETTPRVVLTAVKLCRNEAKKDPPI